jgi:hypothetical protein
MVFHDGQLTFPRGVYRTRMSETRQLGVRAMPAVVPAWLRTPSVPRERNPAGRLPRSLPG